MSEILIIDDQVFMRELLRDELTDEGHRVTCVGDADEVSAVMEETRFDLVLLDLYLDGFEGWTLLEEIKKKKPGIYVIIVTAYDSFKDDPRAGQADDYVIKDIYSDKLKNKISRFFNEKQGIGPDKVPIAGQALS